MVREDARPGLRSAASGARARIRYSEHAIGQGDRMFAEACRLGLEGIISKRRNAPCQAGRADTRLKTRCVHRQEFVIEGFTDPERLAEWEAELKFRPTNAPAKAELKFRPTTPPEM